MRLCDWRGGNGGGCNVCWVLKLKTSGLPTVDGLAMSGVFTTLCEESTFGDAVEAVDDSLFVRWWWSVEKLGR